MTQPNRVRQFASATVVAGLLLALGACGGEYPNSTFNHHTEFNTSIDRLWDTLLFWGTLVFIIVEAFLIYIVFRFRKREGSPPPQMIHGNTAMEITWTVLPIVILVIIAIPTVRTIFETQADPPAGALEVEVYGYQWWWEFRYPQYGFSTANEVYMPVGRTVHFTLRTNNVLHAFWIPQMGGKRDLITNKTNHLWFTPKAEVADSAWNGFCTEYCGASHANMRIRAYTVSAANFDQWVAGQKAGVAFTATTPAAPASGTTGMASAGGNPASAGLLLASQTTPATPAPTTQATPTPGWFFPKEKLPAHVIPRTPYPKNLAFDDATLAGGDPARGEALFKSKGMCGGCHIIQPAMFTLQGPNLTHIASRHTIAAGLFPNEPAYLARWIKNAPRMKPGATMYVLGLNEIDPKTGQPTTFGQLTDAEIADIVAYLGALK